MTRLKNIIDFLDITILNVELYRVGREWNYRNVNSPYSRLYCIKDGCGRIRIHGKDYELRPGGIYLIPAYTTVDMFCEDSFLHYYIHFTTRLLSGMDIFSVFECGCEAPLSGLPAGIEVFERLLELNPGKELLERNANRPIYRQVLERTLLLDRNKTASAIFEENAIMRLLLSRFFSSTHTEVTEKLEGIMRFERVLEYIQENIERPIELAELARIAELHPTYFSNLFTRLIGSSPRQYINRRRIERAQELLLTTDRTLYSIAADVGIGDEYYFSRLFKKHLGISPDHYRRQEQSHHR